MQLLSPEFIERWRDRIVNVHPALLPAFPGLDAIGQALDAGVEVTGVTVHFVDEGVDTGPPILQRAVARSARPRPGRARGRDPRDRARAPARGDPADRGGPGSFDPANPRVVLIAPGDRPPATLSRRPSRV